MARARTTSDVFNAIAESRRREILTLLATDEQSVSELVTRLGCAQPSVSKHLRVLSEVGLVTARRDGKRVLYRTSGEAMRPIVEWTRTFQQLWRRQLSRVKARAEEHQ